MYAGMREGAVEAADSCFKIIWYAEIKNILIKKDVEMCEKFVEKDP